MTRIATILAASALSTVGVGFAMWLLADWIIGTIVAVHYVRANPNQPWVWR